MKSTSARAARSGFRNVIAADVFVHHVGEVSFGGTRRAQAEGAAMVDSLYPEFQRQLAPHSADPLRGPRHRADLREAAARAAGAHARAAERA